MISKEAALMNEVPEGAYIVEVVSGSPADKAGIKAEDIITKMNGKAVKDQDGGLAAIINSAKVGESIEISYYRDGKEETTRAVLENTSQE